MYFKAKIIQAQEVGEILKSVQLFPLGMWEIYNNNYSLALVDSFKVTQGLEWRVVFVSLHFIVSYK